jgi:dTDP-4-dehydrorhamnose reductase
LKNLILITGTNGFIGKDFFETFEKKLIIKKIISKNILNKKNYSKILEAIFIKYKPKIILHFAGYYTKTNSKKDNKISKKINFEYGKILLKFAKKYEVEFFINISTILEFYKSFPKLPILTDYLFLAGDIGQRIILKAGLVPATVPVRLVNISSE